SLFHPCRVAALPPPQQHSAMSASASKAKAPQLVLQLLLPLQPQLRTASDSPQVSKDGVRQRSQVMGPRLQPDGPRLQAPTDCSGSHSLGNCIQDETTTD
ncbi:hypothetical protein Vretimale_11237, partial [Volvox reticuliferus]